ncbi:DUF2304 domain-containing protein [Acanthopleuribacter pedis]|uniref:DUF2304 domain-containing protein n=1 Tax=Acanthopleuribacter pedis TaxID=442870 RepID=A0A8J7U2Z3_9BACT|nr:DUF2304 domain-containing protein [Acanthopleuribacter pedis]MBO1317788.1 DUF2304 domain-containing protein [Acanthopleuribacter pedis]
MMTIPTIIPALTITFLAVFFWLLRRTVKRNLLNQNSLLMWFGVCLFLLGMAVLPSEVIAVSKRLGFETAANALFFLAIGFLMFLNLLQSLEISRLNGMLVRLVQHVAMEEGRPTQDPKPAGPE